MDTSVMSNESLAAINALAENSRKEGSILSSQDIGALLQSHRSIYDEVKTSATNSPH